MKEILVFYEDGTHQLFKLRDIIGFRFHGNFIAIDETKTTVICIHNVKEIKFLY